MSKRRRRRAKLTRLFGDLRLDLTIEEIVSDLEGGWAVRDDRASRSERNVARAA